MTQPKIDPIQEALIQARRNQILEAAMQVFAQKGFQKATIRDVAKTAGIADGTIYNYFENKTALMLGVMDRLNQSNQRETDLSQIYELDLQTFGEVYMRQRYEFLTQEGIDIFRAVLGEVLINADLRQLYLREVVEPTFVVAEKYFTHMAEAGKVNMDNVPLALRVITATFLGTLMLRMLGETVIADQWEALPDLVTAMLLDGIEPK